MAWLALRSRTAALESRLAEIRESRDSAAQELDGLREDRDRLKSEFDRLDATRIQEMKNWEEKQETMRQNHEELLERFQVLSRQALDSNNERFMKVARAEVEKLLKDVEQENQKREHKMEKLVDPLTRNLEEFRKHVKEIEKDRVDAYSSLKQQVIGLGEMQMAVRKETSNLVTALRKPNVRGRWGEIQLRRVVEMAGMLDHCDFEEQHSVGSDEGSMRPDMVIRLPNDKMIVVDSKVSLDAYLEGSECESEEDRSRCMTRHASQVRKHLTQLGKKAYHDQFKTAPDLVVLFLPGESFYYAALQADSSLIEAGAENNVIIATPTTLIALLRAVAFGWRQEQITENARRISDLGQELYSRLSSFVDHFDKVGRHLNTAVGTYNKAVGSLESRVLVSARKFQEMGAHSSKQLAETNSIETTVRSMEAPELFEVPKSSSEPKSLPKPEA